MVIRTTSTETAYGRYVENTFSSRIMSVDESLAISVIKASELRHCPIDDG
jgi:hypothetical protein